jgi:hypothetical protein
LTVATKSWWPNVLGNDKNKFNRMTRIFGQVQSYLRQTKKFWSMIKQ